MWIQSFFAWFAYFAVVILQICSAPAGFLLVTYHLSLFTSFPLASSRNVNYNDKVDVTISPFKR